MPDAPPKPCHHPGCRSFALAGKARCAAHLASYDTTTRRNSATLARAAQIRGSTAWKKVRAAFVADFPLCCDPFDLHKHGPETTDDVHHVLPVATHPHLALTRSNLRPLCRPCHLRRTAGQANRAEG